MSKEKTALFCRFFSLWVFCFPGIYRGRRLKGKKNRVFDKGQTAALFSTFSFGHVLQYAPFSLHLNALHFILLSNTKRRCYKTSFATPPHYALFVFVFFERNGAVEDQMFGRGIGVYIVIARTREL